MPTKPLRIFHLESPGPLEAFDDEAEGPVLTAIAPLIGHSIHRKTVHSRLEFKTALRFLSTIESYSDREKDRPLVLHISAHGLADGKGISLGADDTKWKHLVRLLQPFVEIGNKYKGEKIVVLSACNASEQTMSSALACAARKDSSIVPPQYFFCTEQDVSWDHAAVGWTLFYHLLPTAILREPRSVKRVLKQIASLDIRIHYFRWDKQAMKYMRYPPRSQ